MADMNSCTRIAEEVAKTLKADSVVTVEEGEYPAVAVTWGGSHLVLVRDFGSSFGISLPIEPGFSFRTLEEFAKGSGPIIEAVAAYRKKYPNAVTMADAVIKLRPALPSDKGKWVVNFPGTPAPSEGWIENDENQIGLFQSESSIRVVVWVGSDMRSLGISSAEKLASLPEWVLPNLPAQTETATRMADEEKKRAAIKPPSVPDVLEALRGGKRLQLGAGRWYETYLMTDGKLRREIFDEGHVDEEDATEEELQDSLKSHAAQAREQL